jgi:hypothetical protein
VRRPRFVLPTKAVTRGLPVALLVLGAACADPAPSSPTAVTPEETPLEVTDALRMDAGELAKDTGMSLDEAIAVLQRQPLVGKLGRALKERGPASFGGLFLDYVPEYRITLLALPGGGDEVTRAVDALGFAELSPFTVARETPYTEAVLKEAQRMVAELGGNKVTTLGLDIRTGEILATVASSEDADAITAAVDAADPPVPAPVVVSVPKGAGYVTGAVAEISDISVHPARVRVGDRAQLRVDRSRATWGLPWILERLEEEERDTRWKWVGNLKAGPGKQWKAEFYIGHTGGGYEDIGFGGPASIDLVIPELEAGRYRLGQEFIRPGRKPLEERLVWHFAEFEVVD